MKSRAWRYWTVIGAFSLFAIFVLYRYAALAAHPNADPEAQEIAIDRGDIVDRSGRILAMDTALYNVAVWKPETDPRSFPADAERLASILGLNAADIRKRWADGGSDFFYLAKRVQPQEAKAIQAAKANGDFQGVVVEKVSGRLYPEKSLASHLVGFVGDGNRGLAGIERKYDEELLPDSVPFSAMKPGGRPRGDTVVLSIDADIQYSLEQIARKAWEDNKAQSVILLAMNAKTGELLAYVAMPDFDPNDYLASPPEDWYDWPSVYAYEPGSVFKIFSLSSVVDLGGCTFHSLFYCDGAYHHTTPSGQVITIKCLGDHGWVNIQKILQVSCNAGAGYASDTVDPDPFYTRLKLYGFGSPTMLGLPGETAGLLRPPDQWSARSKPTIAIGQEILVSALQMVTAATVITNGGVLLKPIVVERLVDPAGTTVWNNAPQPVRRVISAKVAAKMLKAMQPDAMIGGTGFRAGIHDIPMATKTGTAQMIDPKTHAYSDTDYIASTMAIFPANDPRIILYLVIIKPHGSQYYGGRIAAPVVREAAESILSLTDIPRGESPVVEHSRTVTIPPVTQIEIGSTMPDLTGTPKRLLLGLLGRKDIKVHMSGEGYVVKQTPAPGTPVSLGAEINLELK